MVNFYDDLKQTVVKMIKKQLDIPVLVSPLESSSKNPKITYPKLLFKSYFGNVKNKIYVIDYNRYDRYGLEEIPKLDASIVGLVISCNKNTYNIVNYDNGVMELDRDILGLSEYNDEIIISEKVEQPQKVKDFILVTCPYNYNRTMNAKTVENFRRFQFDVFIYNDLNEDKIMYYSSILHKIFERDFPIYDKYDKKIKGQFAYIQDQLVFDIPEYNLSNKIVRGTMLIRTYNK